MFLNNLRKSKGIFWLIALLLILAVAALLFFKFKPTERQSQRLNAYTKEVISEYVSTLISLIVDTEDPLEPDSAAKETISSIIDAAEIQDKVIVFNGEVCSDLELFNTGDIYYLKPAGSYMGGDEALEVIKREEVYPQEFFEAIDDDLQRKVIKMYYEEISQVRTDVAAQPVGKESEFSGFVSDVKSALGIEEQGGQGIVESEVGLESVIAKTHMSREFTSNMRGFLDSMLSKGVLSAYEYNPDYDSLKFTYKGESIPFKLNPLLDAQTIYYTVYAYAHPAEYASKALEDYRKRLREGEALIIDTRRDPSADYFIDLKKLIYDLGAIIDGSLTRDQKITKISGGVIFGDPQKSLPKNDKSYQPRSDYVGTGSFDVDPQLLNREGVIVPPTKNIYYLQTADYVLLNEFNIFEVALLGKVTISIFSPFLRNEYFPPVAYIAEWNGKFTEKLEEIISDQSISVLFVSTHGGNKSLLTEVYDLFPNDYLASDDEFDIEKEDTEHFIKRAEELQEKYGKDKIEGLFIRPVIPLEHKELLQSNKAMLPRRLRKLFKGKQRIGTIWINDKFFDEYFKKKAVFILYACHGGSMVNPNKPMARDTLSTYPEYTTSEFLFVNSDLYKISPYLLKDFYPGPIKITDENMRNFDILSSFVNRQMTTGNNSQENSCKNQRDALCSIKLYGVSRETVAVSPHVKYADGERVEFNAPMDKTKDASGVITIEAGQGCEVSKDGLGLKPVWVSDKEISLPWKGKVYRDWKGPDNPDKVPLAKITVHHDKALSEKSRVQLTGNPDCCMEEVCKTQGCWRNPATTEYNANRPKTDFVYFMPCITQYYQACKKDVKPRHVRISAKEKKPPDYITINNNCYQPVELSEEQRKEVQFIEKWRVAGEECQDECMGDLIFCKLKLPIKFHWRWESQPGGLGWWQEDREILRYKRSHDPEDRKIGTYEFYDKRERTLTTYYVERCRYDQKESGVCRDYYCRKEKVPSCTGDYGWPYFIPHGPLFGQSGDEFLPTVAYGSSYAYSACDIEEKYPQWYKEQWGRGIYINTGTKEFSEPDATRFTEKKIMKGFECYSPKLNYLCGMSCCANREYCIYVDETGDPFTVISTDFSEDAFELPSECR